MANLKRTADYIFKPEHHDDERFFRDTAQVSQQVIYSQKDVLGDDAIRKYFDLYYYQQKPRWDEKDIMECFRLDARQEAFPLKFQFKEASNRFSLIDSWQQSVFIPYDQRAVELLEELRCPDIPTHRNLLRGLQR